MLISTGLFRPAETGGYPDWPQTDYPEYSWLHTEFNTFQFYNRDVLAPLFTKLQQAQSKKVTILHIGDSHVQADVFTGEVRDRLQQAFGFGGRGMVFPYSTGRTHAAIDYTSYHTGRWIYAKNVEQYPELSLGVSGISSRTYDSIAAFRLAFRNTILPEFTRIRVFFKRTAASFDFEVQTPQEKIRVDVFKPEFGDKQVNFIDVDLKSGQNDITFQLVKTDTAQSEFEIYGLSIENPFNGGLLYHSVGINGAGFYSLLRQDLMKEQLDYLKPDAVILDVGANDYWRNGIDRGACFQNMQNTVDILRKHNPAISIIFSGSQDINRGGYSIADCGIFSQLMHEFCEKNDCAFYDWYWIAGGRFSMSLWRSNALANKDFIHLSGNGYRLKGQLIAEAWNRTYNWYAENDTSKSLVYNIDSLVNPPVDTTKKPVTDPVYGWVYHKVRKGQTIWQVASKYGVTAAQVRSWNRLRSNYLWIGQVLKVYTKLTPGEDVAVTPSTPTTIKPKTPPGVTPKYHKVRSGETLYSIAQKHRTTVAEIKRLNRITGSKIRIGQVLRVK